MRTLRLLVLGALVFGVPATAAQADTHAGLLLGQARTIAARAVQSGTNAAGGGYASIGACHRMTPWKVSCRASISLNDGTNCADTLIIWNTAVVKGYYHRRFSHAGLSCHAPPLPSPPPPPVYTPPPPAPTFPTELPQSVGQGVANNYVGGMMRNARATSGGVSYCGVSVGFSVTCSYSYSGIGNSGAFYYCFGDITVNGIYYPTGWQTSVDLGLGPTCT